MREHYYEIHYRTCPLCYWWVELFRKRVYGKKPDDSERIKEKLTICGCADNYRPPYYINRYADTFYRSKKSPTKLKDKKLNYVTKHWRPPIGVT